MIKIIVPKLARHMMKGVESGGSDLEPSGEDFYLPTLYILLSWEWKYIWLTFVIRLSNI